MKVSNISLALALLLGASLAHAESEETRELGANANKLAKIAARKAKRAAEKAAKMAEPEKDMYFELVYIEKDCSDVDGYYDDALANPPVTDANIGDQATFTCDLYQKAVNYGTYGGEKVGETYWGCEVVATSDDGPSTFGLWDCTITDFISGGLGGTYIRSEGQTPTFFGEPKVFHEGNFATVGGINEAKGIMGQLDVVYDDYKMTFFHIYHVEAWNMGPQADYW